jgi:hypothetical protein
MEVAEEFGYSKVCAYWPPKIPKDAHTDAREANATYLLQYDARTAIVAETWAHHLEAKLR